jgi:hypothetical protein
MQLGDRGTPALNLIDMDSTPGGVFSTTIEGILAKTSTEL